jgi:radical SAM protein with 4Fe4S-binding SPASM domain
MFPVGTTFEITLFCADPKLHDRIAGRRGAFRRVLEGVIAARENGHQVAISVVVNRLNAHLVREALELGIAIGGQAFLLNRMNLSGHTLAAADWLAPTSTQLQQALAAAESVAREYGASIAVAVPIPPCVADPEPYPHLHFGWCPRGGKGAYYTVSHNGLLRPCNHSSAILGDLRTQSFERIVRSRRAAAYRSRVPTECRVCDHPLARACRGGCPAASYECFGRASVVDPLVNIALAAC